MSELVPRIIRGMPMELFVRRGVTQTQFLVLLALHGLGRCSMGALAKSLRVRMPTATGIVSRLVRAGLIRRFPHPKDRRQVLVELSAKGEGFIRQFKGLIRRRWEQLLKPLGPEELASFHRVITRIQERLETPSPS